jgi:DNA-binding transcriptional regulator YiaG
MNKKYQSEALMVCHQDAVGLYKLGFITDAQMQEFDKDCLVPEPVAKTPSASAQKIPTPAYTSPRKA